MSKGANMKNGDKLVMTVEEAGRCLGVSRPTAYLLAKQGKIPVIRLGPRRLVVPIAALYRMLENAGCQSSE
jgi:excisionase family DNA binding protein